MKWRLALILVLTLLAAYVVWPQEPGNYIPDGAALPGNPGIHLGSFQRQGAKLGLDLQGGTALTLQADLSGVPADQQTDAMKGVLNVIERRVNAYGVAESEIQQQGNDRIIVQLPGVKDIEQAKQLIGQTAKLEFKEQDASGNWVPATGQLNGQHGGADRRLPGTRASSRSPSRVRAGCHRSPSPSTATARSSSSRSPPSSSASRSASSSTVS